MTLSKYLAESDGTASSLARQVGVSHSTVLRWADGSMEPTLGMLRRLFTATGGKVQPNDFLETKPTEQAA